MSAVLHIGLIVNPLAGLGGSLAPTSPVRFSCWAGDMGESALQQLDFATRVLGSAGIGLTTASDTRMAAQQLYAAGVDISVFAGGDGTARDVYDVVGARCPVLGIPAGVKMHSGVFAVSPEAAGELLLQLARCGLAGGSYGVRTYLPDRTWFDHRGYYAGTEPAQYAAGR